VSQYISNPDEAKIYTPRYKLFYYALAFAISIFSIRLWYLQIISGHELRQFSEKNRIKQNKITAPRGLFIDRGGKSLVDNLSGYEAIISPQYVENLEDLARVIAPHLDTTAEKIIQKVKRSKKINGPFTTIRIKENLSRNEVFRLKRVRLDTPGLEIRESIIRNYPLKENGAQLFGYVGEISKKQLPTLNEKYRGLLSFEQGDIIGKSGLEENLEKDIRGQDGLNFIQVDAHGRETITQTPNIYGEQIRDKAPLHGNNVVLTIDRDIQEAAYASFVGLERIGSVVAIKSNGEVLAWLSTPSFNPNDFPTGISSQIWSKLVNDPFKPLRNKVIQDHYSPGSTFKPFIALAALQEKEITPETIVNAPGQFRFGNRTYHDHLKGGHGNINVFQAIERSSNVFFYKMGIALGIDKMYNYMSLLGLGSKTGIELVREAPGRMPSAQWKKEAIGEEWQPGENLSTAIGQGYVTVTALQMALAYNAIGLEGQLVRPFVIKKVIDQDGKVLKETFPSIVRDLSEKQNNGFHISKETFKTVKEGLRLVANGAGGTARHWKVPGLEMAGKTGTVQVMSFSSDQIYANCNSRPINLRHHGWFVGYAPADKPEIAVAVLAEHACHGSTGAAPVVRDIIQAYFKKYHPEIIEQGLKKSKVEKNISQPIIPTDE
jgi:penicillin-binding protein 2